MRTLTRLARAVAISIAIAGILLAAARAFDGGGRATNGLVVSLASNRTDASPLAGKSLVGRVYIFVGTINGIRKVRYFLDDPQMSHPPRRVTSTPPFDF